MNRILTREYNDAIEKAFDIIPKGLHQYLQCDWVLGADPNHIGLHFYEISYEVGGATFGYGQTAHCVYEHHQEHRPLYKRNTTVVLPDMSNYIKYNNDIKDVVVHELGHVLDRRLQDISGITWTFKTTTEYSKKNRAEAFAEQFCTWLLPNYEEYKKDLSYYAIELFESAARGTISNRTP